MTIRRVDCPAETTFWHCGTVSAKNETVDYSQGAVHEMTKTNVCAEPGDSGGSFIRGDQAQGVTSGGCGNCSSGGETWFQPVNEILSRYGLTLHTAGTIPASGCRGLSHDARDIPRGAPCADFAIRHEEQPRCGRLKSRTWRS